MLSEVTVFKELIQLFNYLKLDLLARDSGFIRRRGKFRAIDLIRLCVFWNGKESFPTLDQMVNTLRQHRVHITKQSLDQRFNKPAVRFIKKLVSRVLKVKLTEGMNMQWAGTFRRILVIDSTLGELFEKCQAKFPGFGGSASVSAVKIQYCFDLLSGDIQKLQLQAGRCNDSGKYLTGVKKGDLCLFDLGYFGLATFDRLTRIKAFFLTRIKSNTIVSRLVGGELERVDLLKIISKMKEGQYKDMEVYLGQKTEFPVRLILYKLPQQISSENRGKLKKLRKWKGKTFSKNRAAFCDVNAFITNLDEVILPPKLPGKYTACAGKWKSYSNAGNHTSNSSKCRM